ncbi:MAG: 30S ribosomal protein S20 [Oscillospiraceae bacterium]|nr:30S ribosomal protein S20 [Oscillospiraceae bacterium]
MPNIKSAKKRVLVTAAKAAQNKSERTSLKTAIKKVHLSVAEGDNSKAGQAYLVAQSSIDKAAQHGLIHKNTAARRKSKLARAVSGM